MSVAARWAGPVAEGEDSSRCRAQIDVDKMDLQDPLLELKVDDLRDVAEP